jgi:hypothetical protein
MSKFNDPLDNIQIASPCPADWNEMYGDGRKRFCGDCKLNVYNLSGMTRSEAEALIMNAEGRLCVRFYRRADGSVITKDCPVGWAKVKQRTRVYATAIASLLMALFTGVLFVSLVSRRDALVGVLQLPLATATPTPPREPTMGAIAMPPPNTNANTKPRDPATQGNVAVPSTKTEKFEIGKMRVLRPQDANRRVS